MINQKIQLFIQVQTKVGHYREGKEFTRTETVLGTGNMAGDIIVVKDNNTEKESAHKTVSSQIKLILNMNTNMTSFFRFVKIRAIYRMGITSLAHAPVHVTDFPVVNVHVDELSSGSINCVRHCPQT
jgi:hypothetical protein